MCRPQAFDMGLIMQIYAECQEAIHSVCSPPLVPFLAGNTCPLLGKPILKSRYMRKLLFCMQATTGMQWEGRRSWMSRPIGTFRLTAGCLCLEWHPPSLTTFCDTYSTLLQTTCTCRPPVHHSMFPRTPLSLSHVAHHLHCLNGRLGKAVLAQADKMENALDLNNPPCKVRLTQITTVQPSRSRIPPAPTCCQLPCSTLAWPCACLPAR